MINITSTKIHFKGLVSKQRKTECATVTVSLCWYFTKVHSTDKHLVFLYEWQSNTNDLSQAAPTTDNLP